MRNQTCSLAARSLLILLTLAPASALLIAAGCSTPSQRASPGPAQAAASDPALFVGSAACAECHPAEYDLHRGSRHATTLRPAAHRSLGNLVPPLGPIPKSVYAVREQAGGLRFERTDQPAVGAPIRFALGSGKDAMTYVGEFGAESLTEFRMTYLPPRRAWCVTPGQGTLSNLHLGKTHEMGMARRCIQCHAVKTAPGSSEPAPGFLGVGCESCHGPGGKHIAAVTAGRAADHKMEAMRRWTAAKINAVCTRCHRALDDVTIEKEDASLTARFQGYGLEQSPCFKKSSDRLSCITCHDPHTNVSTDRRSYEKVCLSCHTPTTPAPTKSCPINPREQCIACHMPRRPIFPDRRLSLFVADHLILAYRAKP